MTPQKLTGKELERHCISRMQSETNRGTAMMGRYGVHAVPSHDGAQIRWRPIKSLPDFEGMLIGGQHFIFDCKATSSGYVGLNESSVKARQLDHLLNRATFGAACFLLIHFNTRILQTRTYDAATYAFPCHPHFAWWRDSTKRTLNLHDARANGVPVAWSRPKGGRFLRPDLVPAIRLIARLIHDINCSEVLDTC